VADLSWVTGRLAIGGKVESLYDAKKIAAEGVTHVLNLRAGDKKPEHVSDEAPWWAQANVAYALNPTHDDGEKKPKEWFQKSIEYAFDVLSKSGTKLLIHCKEGFNRSPSTAYAILQAWGTSAKDALAHVKEAKPEAELAYKADADRAVKALGYV